MFDHNVGGICNIFRIWYFSLKSKKHWILRLKWSFTVFRVKFSCYFSFKRIFNEIYTIWRCFPMTIFGARAFGAIVAFTYLGVFKRYSRNHGKHTVPSINSECSDRLYFMSYSFDCVWCYRDLCRCSQRKQKVSDHFSENVSWYCLGEAASGLALGGLADEIFQFKQEDVLDGVADRIKSILVSEENSFSWIKRPFGKGLHCLCFFSVNAADLILKHRKKVSSSDFLLK